MAVYSPLSVFVNKSILSSDCLNFYQTHSDLCYPEVLATLVPDVAAKIFQHDTEIAAILKRQKEVGRHTLSNMRNQ